MARLIPLRRLRRLLSRREDGQMLALFAAGLVGFCGLVGISVDIGKAVFTASDMQKIADAAALAGAQDLPNTSTATNTANAYGTDNGSATLNVSFSNSNQTISVAARPSSRTSRSADRVACVST